MLSTSNTCAFVLAGGDATVGPVPTDALVECEWRGVDGAGTAGCGDDDVAAPAARGDDGADGVPVVLASMAPAPALVVPTFA